VPEPFRLSEFSLSFTAPLEVSDELLALLRPANPPLYNLTITPSGEPRPCPRCGADVLELTALGVRVSDQPGAAGCATLNTGAAIGWDRPRGGWRCEPCGHVFEREGDTYDNPGRPVPTCGPEG
jgi:hypothetical protein